MASTAPPPFHVLVLGSTGALGQHVLRAVLARAMTTVHPSISRSSSVAIPIRVSALVRDVGKFRRIHGEELMSHPRLTVVTGDASNVEDLRRVASAHACVCAAGRPDLHTSAAAASAASSAATDKQRTINDLDSVVSAVVEWAAGAEAGLGGLQPYSYSDASGISWQVPPRIVFTGGIGITSAPAPHGMSGLLPLLPPEVRTYTQSHAHTLETARRRLRSYEPGVRASQLPDWTVICPAYMRESPTPESVPPATVCVLTADRNPSFPPTCWSRFLACAPAACSAVTFGAHAGGLTIEFAAVAEAMVRIALGLCECAGTCTCAVTRCWGHAMAISPATPRHQRAHAHAAPSCCCAPSALYADESLLPVSWLSRTPLETSAVAADKEQAAAYAHTHARAV